jgi:hypothetical protein
MILDDLIDWLQQRGLTIENSTSRYPKAQIDAANRIRIPGDEVFEFHERDSLEKGAVSDEWN